MPKQARIGGRFTKSCGSLIHSKESDENNLKDIKGVKPRVKQTDILKLLSLNIITTDTKCICITCLEKALPDYYQSKPEQSNEPNCDEPTDKLSAPKEYTQLIDSICCQIKTDISNIYTNCEGYNDLNQLRHLSPEIILKQRPENLVKLIFSLCGISSAEKRKDEKDYLIIAKIIELIYGVRNSRLVMPVSFCENIITYTATHSKKLVNYNAKVSPAGSYWFIENWLTSQAVEPVIFPEGMVRCLFDNEQKVGKTWRINLNGKFPLSVITSSATISLDKDSEIQGKEHLKPKYWRLKDISPENCYQNIESKEMLWNDEDYYRSTRNNLIKKRLNVLKQQAEKEGDIIQKIINQKRDLSKIKICSKCGAENDATYKTCRNCGEFSLNRQNFRYENENQPKSNILDIFPAIHAHSNNAKVICGEPDLCNPNSYENIVLILRNLGFRAGITKYVADGKRSWLFLEVDGAIYVIIDQIMEHTYKCNHCQLSFFEKNVYADHGCKNLSYEREFDWIVLFPGILHIEMNACKAFMKLNWEIFTKEVAKELGFKTENALNFAFKCSDHHKTWSILEIILFAFTDELLYPYVLSCRSKNKNATIDDYWNWSADIVNPNYLFIQQMIFTFLHSIMMFRVGVRNNDHKAILTAQRKTMPLFFSRNHPTYRKIMLSSFNTHCLLPDELKLEVYKNMAVSNTNSVGHFQGGDTCLEEINKKAKKWVSPIGIPNDQDWLKTFRNLDKLEDVSISSVGKKHVVNLVCKSSLGRFQLIFFAYMLLYWDYFSRGLNFAIFRHFREKFAEGPFAILNPRNFFEK